MVDGLRFTPLIFNTEMVQMILVDLKHATRRDRKLKRLNAEPDNWMFLRWMDGNIALFEQWRTGEQRGIRCPYGGVGDRLWVRESFCHVDGNTYYRADMSPEDLTLEEHIVRNCPELANQYPDARWKPSIHMPKKLARLFLVITSVKVERLQDISRGDCMDEGCPFPNIAKETDPRQWFAELWDSINKDRGYGWDVNPWVWVIGFRRLHGASLPD